MKKQILLISLSFFIILSCLFSACTADKLSVQEPPANHDSATAPTTDYDVQIRQLESMIAALQKNQSLSEAEYQKELAALTEQLEALRAEAENAKKDPPTEETEPIPSGSRFLYRVTEGKAIITGYTGKETALVIPSAIDGYAVQGIADSAFSSQTLKSVTISSGICRIDWFAFCECPNLEAITIPSTVTTIGYSALPTHAKTLTVYCHADSFALTYAKSYGLNYAVI